MLLSARFHEEQTRESRPTMKVGFDYFPAVTHAPGRGRYARELVRALAELAPEEVDLRLFDMGRGDRAIPTSALGPIDGRDWIRRKILKWPRRLVGWVDRAFGFGADGWVGGCDLFHHTSPEPLLVEHAIEIMPIPELPPDGTTASEVIRKQLVRIEHVVVFSNSLKAEVIRRYEWPEDRIHVTPVGCDHWVRELDGLPEPSDPPYLLVLGAMREVRSPHRIRKSFERLAGKHEGLRLVFCGRAGDASEQFLRDRRFSAARDSLEWIDQPDERELPALVAKASVLVHLNEDEGTAVTVLEALRAGVPVACSRLPALTEVLGNIAHYVDDEANGQPDPLDAAIEAALQSSRDPAARERRIELATPYSWKLCAERTLEIWNSVLETTAPRRSS